MRTGGLRLEGDQVAKGEVAYARCLACGERDQWTRPGQWAGDPPRCGFCGAGLVPQDEDDPAATPTPSLFAPRPPAGRVACEVAETELEGDHGRPVPGVCATCTRCGHETESYGTSERSVTRCLVVMREECPEGESNYYVADVGG